MASTKTVETRNFGTYNKRDIKNISGHVDGRSTSERSNRSTDTTKNLKGKLQKSTESVKRTTTTTKLEDLKQEAHVAQRSREEREDERRKRIDELRMRNNDRRNRVEERKRLIFEAEREKQLAILRKNQEIEARIEARKNKENEEKKRKKNERSNTPVAFGSSTPRMLCLNDTNGSFCSSCRNITKEHDNSKKQASIIVGGHGKKRNEERPSESSSSFNLRTISKRIEQTRRMRTTPRRGPATNESIYISNLKVFAPSPRNSDETTTTTPTSGRSRSNSTMSQRSTSTNSMDSCNVKLRPRTIVKRQEKPIVDNSILVSLKINCLSRETKLTPMKSPQPKVHSTPKRSSISLQSEIKKSTTPSRVEEEDQRLMEETMRLANEMMEMEKQKLRIAMEETKRWEEEEQRRLEEKARKKLEREEAEKKAMEQAEKQRIEFFERLKKSEEERLARRKRVEIIMLRTRG